MPSGMPRRVECPKNEADSLFATVYSKAILSRKAYPLAPDESMPENGHRYEQRRGRVYYGKDLDLSRLVALVPPVSRAR